MVSSVFGQSQIEQIALQAKLLQPSNTDRFADTARHNFNELLQAHGSNTPSSDNMTDEQKIRLAAQQLVATTLLKPIFSQIRQDPFKSDLFNGGRTEKIFGEQLDNILADRMVKKQGFGLVDSVYNNFMKNAQKAISLDAQNIQQGIDLHG